MNFAAKVVGANIQFDVAFAVCHSRFDENCARITPRVEVLLIVARLWRDLRRDLRRDRNVTR